MQSSKGDERRGTPRGVGSLPPGGVQKSEQSNVDEQLVAEAGDQADRQTPPPVLPEAPPATEKPRRLYMILDETEFVEDYGGAVVIAS